MRIATILTCHNRRDTTLACLRALYACHLPAGCSIDAYLVDDGSTDGTGAAVRASFPAVNVIDGDGSLFWNGGMRVAFAAAMVGDYDAYLWLNDDTTLFPDAMQKLLATADGMAAGEGGRRGIIVGSTCDPTTRRLTYGGLVSRSRWAPNTYIHLMPGDLPLECDSLNGNCVLIPREVAKAVGNIDGAFIHAIGDWDYGLRARRAGFSIWIAPGFAGQCSENAPAIIPLAEAANVRAQLRRICGPKGVPPRAWRDYVRRHCGLLWPVHFARPYLGAILRALQAKVRLACSSQ